MKITNLLRTTKAKLGISLLAVALIAGVATQAQARTQYTDGGMGTSKTPVFNEFYDVPNGVGDEADFVRLKTKAGTNGDYISTLNDDCAVGDAFNVRTYIHNGADPEYNDTGEAIARNTVLAMNAELGDGKAFDFSSTISASNAASVSDSGTLQCQGNVRLKLVPKSVQAYSKPVGGFYALPDTSVNGTTQIGSRVAGDGNVYGCWDDRVIVVYEVVVEQIPEEPKAEFSCDLLEVLKLSDRTYKFTVKASATNTEITDYKFNVKGGGDFDLAQQGNVAVLTVEQAGDYTVRAQVVTADGTTEYNDACTKKVTAAEEPKVPTYSCDLLQYKHLGGRKYRFTTTASASGGATVKQYTYDFGQGEETVVVDRSQYDYEFKTEGDKTVRVAVDFNVGDNVETKSDADCVVTVPATTEQPPKELPKTGAGAVMGLFTAVTAAGTLVHRTATSRRG